MLPNSLRYGLGNLTGATAWLLLPRRRRDMMIDNIARGLNLHHQQAIAIAKVSTTRIGRMIMEVFCLDKLSRKAVNELVIFHGLEHFDAALAQGKGVIFATAHCGNWELLGSALSLNGYPIVGIAQKQHNEQMDRFINEQRRAPGTEIVYRSEVRDVVRLLDKGKIIGLLMDQDAHAKGVFVPFLGRPASTPVGPAAIARLRGAPIVTAFIHEVSPGRHEVFVHPPLTVDKTDDRNADIYRTTEHLTKLVEQHICQYPGEWFWLHNRWKTQPSSSGR